MVLDYRGKDYICRYLNGNEHKSGLCFSSAFGFVRQNHTFITYRIPIEKEELNYVFISEKQMFNYFIELSSIFSFKIISFRKMHDEYRLQVAIPIISDYWEGKRYPLYVSTFIRYVYEHPFSIAVKCALENRHNFSGLNIVAIIQFYLGIFCDKRKCHHHGDFGYVYTNMHPKSQYNCIINNFNNTTTFYYTTQKYITILESLKLFNIKCINQICNSINKIADEVYERDKKNICCW